MKQFLKRQATSYAALSSGIRQYLLITSNYWVFTLTDGALRMLVVLHFHQLGYSPLDIAFLFLFYEVFGVITNLVGGWLGARIGLNNTMNIGLGLQIVALLMLLSPSLSMMWVMAAQAISGIAKDLNKMSAKSAIKLLIPNEPSSTNSSPSHSQHTLFRWVALLTGSKNTLKGVGFFMGGALLMSAGFNGSLLIMIVALTMMWVVSILYLKNDLGKNQHKAKFTQLFSKNRAINALSAARCFLFGARDIWFVVAMPVYLSTQLHWPHWQVGGFLALWIIGYGIVQMVTPKIFSIKTFSMKTVTKKTITTNKTSRNTREAPNGKQAFLWAAILSTIPLLMALGLFINSHAADNTANTTFINGSIIIVGLIIFGIVFAINSSLHSFLIVSLSDKKQVSLDVGFYYMANAMGRLIGTVLSGMIFQWYGIMACLLFSAVFIILAAIFSLFISPRATLSGYEGN